MGVIAIEHIAGHNPYPLDVLNSPMVTFCRPEIASVGLTEKQAVDQGRSVKTGKFPMRPNGKAVIEGETDGFAKVVADAETNDMLGMTIVGPHATELIGGLAMGRLTGSDPGRDRDQRLPAPDRVRSHPRGGARSSRPRAPYLDLIAVAPAFTSSRHDARRPTHPRCADRGKRQLGQLREVANHPTSVRSLRHMALRPRKLPRRPRGQPFRRHWSRARPDRRRRRQDRSPRAPPAPPPAQRVHRARRSQPESSTSRLAGAWSALAKQNATVARYQDRHGELGIQIHDLAAASADGPYAALDRRSSVSEPHAAQY